MLNRQAAGACISMLIFHRPLYQYSHKLHSGHMRTESVPKIITNNTIIFFPTAISILVISNHNSFRVLFDKNDSVYFIWKIYLYFSIENGQPGEPASMCRHALVPYSTRSSAVAVGDTQHQLHRELTWSWSLRLSSSQYLYVCSPIFFIKITQSYLGYSAYRQTKTQSKTFPKIQ